MVFLLLVAGVFLIPSVQIKVAKEGAKWFNNKYQQDLQVERFQYKFPNIIQLEEVFLPDYKGDTLMYFSRIDAEIRGYSQLSKSLHLNNFEAKNARFYLRTHLGDSLSNISYFVQAFDDGKPKDPNRSFNVKSEEVQISGGRFYLDNRNDTSKVHFFWREIQADIDNFLVAGKDVGGDIKALSFRDGRKLEVRDTKGNFLYGPKGVVVQGLELLTGRGHLKGDITLITPSVSSYSHFVDSVVMMGNIDYSAVAAGDVRYFSRAYPLFPTANFKGEFDGTINDLKIRDLDLSVLSTIRASGDLDLINCTSGIDLGINTDNFKLNASTDEAQSIIRLFTDTLPPILNRLGTIKWQGDFYGSLFDFKTRSAISTALAEMEIDAEIHNLRKPENIRYKGRIKATRLDLAAIGNSEDLRTASLDLNLNGQGIDPETMKSTIEGRIHHFYYRDYRYQAMRIDGSIQDGNFEGAFRVADPNLALDFNGIASFSGDTSRYDFTAKVDSANLYALNFVEDSLAQFKGDLKMDFLALDYDRWEGSIDLFDVNYRNSRKLYPLQDVAIVSNGLDSLKSLSIRSGMLDADLSGKYSFKGLNKILKMRIEKYRQPNVNLAVEPVYEDFEYNIEFKNTAALSQSLLPQFLVEPGTKLNGGFRSLDQLLEVNLVSDGLRYQDQIATNINLRWLSGFADLLNFDVGSYLRDESEFQLDSISLVNVFAGDSMNYQLDMILRGNKDSYGSFEGLIAILDTGAYRMQIDKGDFNIGKRKFQIDTNTVMRLDSGGFSIDWLQIEGPSLKMNASGFVSNNPYQILRINLEELNLDLLNSFGAKDKAQIEGMVNGEIIANELLGQPRFISSVLLDSLRLNEQDLGQMEVESDYEHQSGKMSIDALMKLRNLEMVEVRGYYDNSAGGELDLNFNFNRFRLAALEPFAAPIAENLRGLATGTLSVKGPAAKPEIKGEFELPKAGMTISFLQTDYNLVGEPKLLLDNESIRFPNLELMDANHSVSYLNGEVRHKAFTDFYVDLQIDARNLLALNTTAEREDAYYGKAYATGNIKVQGPPSAIKVNALVASEKGTEFYIPISGATEVKQSGYVNFLSPEEEEDSLEILGANFALDEGVSLDFDMNINSNALVSIILNESTGNRLDGKGNGLINMKLEPNRDLELYGTYTVEEGIYRFNIEGLLAKNFLVQEGGTVVWNGDPYEARLDLTAVYKTKANPGILTGETAGTATDVSIYLYIKGALTNPNINFAINLPKATSSTQAIVANRLNTDQAINQQAFSLLALNSFTPPGNFLEGTRESFNQWDLLAGQAAAFLNRFTGDYEVSLSYQPATQGQTTTAASNSQEELEVGLSKDFLDDRLTVNSSVEVPLNENNNSIAGDFELIYKLTKDGRVRAKAFNRSVDNNFNFSIGQQQLYQQGIGLSFKVDFETYQDLWTKVLSEARREEEPKPESED